MAISDIVVAAKKRVKSTKGNLSAIRRAGSVPGVIYGLKSEPTLVEIVASDLRKPLALRNAVFKLDIEGQVEMVMCKQVERDPIRRDLIHIDFLRVDESHPVNVVVPVNTNGIPVGVKQQGGVFSVMKKNVRLRTSITNIPEQFNIDISEMPAGQIFYVRDLKIENGSFLTPPKTALFGVTSGRAKEDEAATPAGKAAAAKAPEKKK